MFERYDEMQGVISNVTSSKYASIYAEEYAQQLSEGLEENTKLQAIIESAKLASSEYVAERGIAEQLQQVAKLIAARESRGAERDIFAVGLGGFDHHGGLIRKLEEKFGSIDRALRTFVAELKAQNVFDDTVLVIASEFGRSLRPSGDGTTHGWAGNYFVLGGSVNGGHVLNDFPASLLEGGEQDSRWSGRLIPKYPWETMMVPIAEWMGVEESQLAEVFPNLANFNRSSHILGRSVLFKNEAPTNTPAPSTCMPWCFRNAAEWSKKCGWPACSTCDECEESSA